MNIRRSLFVALLLGALILLLSLFLSDDYGKEPEPEKTANQSDLHRSDSGAPTEKSYPTNGTATLSAKKAPVSQEREIGDGIFEILCALIEAQNSRDEELSARCVRLLKAREPEAASALTLSYAAMNGSPEILFERVPADSRRVRETCAAAQFSPILRTLSLALDPVTVLLAIRETLPMIEAHMDRDALEERYTIYTSPTSILATNYVGLLCKAEVALCDMASVLLTLSYSNSTVEATVSFGSLAPFFEALQNADFKPLDIPFRMWTNTLSPQMKGRSDVIETMRKKFNIPEEPAYQGDIFWLSGFVHELSTRCASKLSGYRLANLKRAMALAFKEPLLTKGREMESRLYKQVYDFCGTSIELDPLEMLEKLQGSKDVEAARAVIGKWFSSPYFLKRDFSMAYSAMLQTFGDNAAASILFSFAASTNYSQRSAKETLYTVLFDELLRYSDDAYSRLTPLLINLTNVARLHCEYPTPSIFTSEIAPEAISGLGNPTNLELAKRLFERHSLEAIPNPQALSSIASIAIESGAGLHETGDFLSEIFEKGTSREAANALTRGLELLWRFGSIYQDYINTPEAESTSVFVSVLTSLLGRRDIIVENKSMLPNVVVSLAIIPRILQKSSQTKSLFDARVLVNAEKLLGEIVLYTKANQERIRYAFQDLVPYVRAVLDE